MKQPMPMTAPLREDSESVQTELATPDLSATATLTRPPVPETDRPADSGPTALNIALAGVLVTAALTLLLQVLTTWNRNRRDYDFLLRTLEHEVENIGSEATRRSQVPPIEVTLVPDLPASAWIAWSLSQHRWRLALNEQRALESLYAKVALANAKSQAIPTFLQIAVTSVDQEIRDVYRLEAGNLATEPMAEVHAAIRPAQLAIATARAWRRRMLLP